MSKLPAAPQRGEATFSPKFSTEADEALWRAKFAAEAAREAYQQAFDRLTPEEQAALVGAPEEPKT